MRQEIVIGRLEVADESECGNCAAPHLRQSGGTALFLASNWKPLCNDCGKVIAPMLAALLELEGAAEDYACYLLPDGTTQRGKMFEAARRGLHASIWKHSLAVAEEAELTQTE